jgi:hypothetical protein
MIHPRAILTLAIVLLGISACTPKSAPAPATAPAPDRAAWRPLFNGRDLTGWKTTGTAEWRVDQSGAWPAMILGGQAGDPKRSGMLQTVDAFGNFELELEFMIDEHGKYNSGVYLRNKPDSKNADRYQVNIGRAAVQEYTGGVFTDKWLAKGDERDECRKPLDWNAMRIVADGPRVAVWLNGHKVSDVTDPAPDPKALSPGTIALQTYGAEGHAGWVKFRNVRVRELPAAPEREGKP